MGTMAMPLADVADRLTIFQLKVERLPQDDTVSELHGLYESEFEQRMHSKDPAYVAKMQELLRDLYNANRATWDLEYAIRIGTLTEERDLEEIGRRAIAIRESNKMRIGVKNAISRLACEHHGLDKKVDHGSE